MDRMTELPRLLDATYRVPEHACASFARDGHLKLTGVLGAEELAAYREPIRRAVFESKEENHAMEQKVAGASKQWLFVNNLWTLDALARRFVLSRRFGHIAAQLMGVDGVRLFRDQSYFKAPGGINTPWHQDAYFMPLDTDRIVTFWIPLTDVTPDMAPMSYVSGSHRAGYLGTSNGDDANMDEFERGLSAKGFRIENYGVFAPGDIAVHAGMTLHSSRCNTSDRMREALVIVLFADGAHVAPEPKLNKNSLPQEYYATLIRRQNRATSVPGLTPGSRADGPMTPLVYSAEPALRSTDCMTGSP
jgi:hypothetical protein